MDKRPCVNSLHSRSAAVLKASRSNVRKPGRETLSAVKIKENICSKRFDEGGKVLPPPVASVRAGAPKNSTTVAKITLDALSPTGPNHIAAAGLQHRRAPIPCKQSSHPVH